MPVGWIAQRPFTRISGKYIYNYFIYSGNFFITCTASWPISRGREASMFYEV